MQKGTVARLMDKGYGFIKIDGQSKDLFFHSNELQNAHFDDIREGDVLEFEVAEGPKGPSAVNIKRI